VPSIGAVRLRLPAPVSIADRQVVIARSDARLLRTIRDYASFDGDGQEMGREADGPEVNRRRTAISAMYARHGDRVAEKLPRRRNITRDLLWRAGAELQPIEFGKPFDFSWSTNPMSTPEVLDALALERADRAEQAAAAIKAKPGLDRSWPTHSSSFARGVARPKTKDASEAWPW
jgi:hypothetical protein